MFRSLEMAYQASTMPFKNHSTIYDVGSSVSLWVSAFEILSHPQKGKASLSSVLKLLGGYDWNDKILKRKTYIVKYGGKSYKVSLAEKLYKELYDTRNDFLHGNPVTDKRLYPFKNKNLPLLIRFAPILYKIALLYFLDKFKSKRRSKKAKLEELTAKIFNERNLSDALLKAKQ
ncbi:MAG: hypothetical protein AB1610_00615 [Nitrospirota bacterium]